MEENKEEKKLSEEDNKVQIIKTVASERKNYQSMGIMDEGRNKDQFDFPIIN